MSLLAIVGNLRDARGTTTKACNMAGDGAEEVLQSLIDTLELCVGKIKGKVV